MAGPAFPTNVDSTYGDGATADVKLHQQYHDTIHTMLNKHDKDAAVPADATEALFSNGSLYAPRNLADTDIPAATVNSQSGTSYTLVLADAGKTLETTNGSTVTVTIPTNASVAFPVKTRIMILQVGAGQVSVSGAGGVTVAGRGISAPVKTAGQYAAIICYKQATDTWVIWGDISA